MRDLKLKVALSLRDRNRDRKQTLELQASQITLETSLLDAPPVAERQGYLGVDVTRFGMEESLMNSTAPPRLDDLIALNREIVALVKAGIPLELGLRGLGGSVANRLSGLSHRLADRLSNGLSLPEALEQEGPAVSPIYTAVVGAGLQSGQLGEALESLTLSAQVEQDARQRIALSLIYPALVVMIGHVLFVMFVLTVTPAYLSMAEMFRFPNCIAFDVLHVLYDSVPLWGVLVPVALVSVLIAVTLLRGRRAGSLLAWRLVPGAASVHRYLNWSQFVEMLRLQVAHGLPLGTAFRRAGEATDNGRLRVAATRISADLQRGASLSEALPRARALPPLMRWMLATSEQQGTLTQTLDLLSVSYRRRALQRAALFKFWLPVLTTVFVSGAIVLVYSLLFFIPLRALWTGLMNE